MHRALTGLRKACVDTAVTAYLLGGALPTIDPTCS